MAEKEYIERKKAYTLAKKVCKAVDSNPRVLLPRIILDLIDDLPAADVRPVVRGTWEPVVAANEDGSPYQAGIHCSECGHFDVWEFNFCPNCGAKMEES